jgi:hypothetical protein
MSIVKSPVITAKQLMQGKTAEWDKQGVLTQPIQMLPRENKDKAWKHQNMDWWEHIGVAQLKEKYKRLYKNYNLASGVIDKTDYIPDSSNQYGEMISILTAENETPYEIRFYPLAPNILNVLTGEFSKRNNNVVVKAIDQYAINEMLDRKKGMVTDYVIAKAKQALALKLSQNGVELDSEEAQAQFQAIPNLPQIQEFFNKSYRSIAEQWATHELAVAEEKYRLYELETYAFKDKLISGEEFWHVRLLEDDYEVELWSPINTFYHRSPSIPYVSDCNYVGRIHLLSIADVIDRFGHKMTESELKSLQEMTGSRANHGKAMSADAMPVDFYNPSKSKDEQIQSVYWNQAVAMKTLTEGPIDKPMFQWLAEDDGAFTNDFLIVTEVYWKSQKRMGNLKEIREDGSVYEDIVSEDFVVTEPPKYDTTVIREKTADNLIEGQHIDWFWVNEVWQGTKIGLSFVNSWAGMSDNFEPIYLDVKPLPFQFKSDSSLYNAKLPVEGFLGYHRNVKRTSLIDNIKAFQVGYNMVNNQIFDMLVDEIGNVIMIDQNMIPRNSMDGSWGKHNFKKAYQVMKNFGMLPVDTSITSTEVPINFNQTSVVNLEKTNQLVTRIQISEYFKNECFSAVGITPQRLGSISASESATGVQQAINNSYAQTEMYFVEHSNYLMPRVKEMILNAAQYINGNKDNVQISYINKEEENVFFEIEGTKLLLSDLKIYTTSKPDQKAILDQLKQLAANNNTSTASIFDLAKIIQSNSATEILETLKKSVDNVQKQQEQQLEAEKERVQMQIDAQNAQVEAQRQFEAEQSDLQRANERYIAEIKVLTSGQTSDSDDNGTPDILELAKFNADLAKAGQDMEIAEASQNAETVKNARDQNMKERELALKRQELQAKITMKEKDIKLAKDNMANDEKIARINAKNRNKSKPK